MFNSVYFLCAYSNWILWQSKGKLEDKSRIQVFFGIFLPFVNFWVAVTIKKKIPACPECFFLSLKSFFRKKLLQAAQHCAACLLLRGHMVTVFCPLLEKFCPLFKHFAHLGSRVQVAQTVVDFAHFQVQARKSTVLGWGWGRFVSPKGVCD